MTERLAMKRNVIYFLGSMEKGIILGIAIACLIGCSYEQTIQDVLSTNVKTKSTLQEEGTSSICKSKKYYKYGIMVVSLKGNPYELGYSRGVLLKHEIKKWMKNSLSMIDGQFSREHLDTNGVFNKVDELEKFIPQEYKTELKGLSAGSGLDYKTLLMLNVLSNLNQSCTSLVAVGSDGMLLRSRNYDYVDLEILKPVILYLYKPSHGYEFMSVHAPGIIGVATAMNEKGITFGSHAITGSKSNWSGMPSGILNRQVIQYAGSIENVDEILIKSPRSLSKIWLVTDSEKAYIYEFNDREIARKEMDGDHLVLTNHCQVLTIGEKSSSSLDRFDFAKSFLLLNKGKMDLKKLIALNRSDLLSWEPSESNVVNLHSVIFRPASLDFWLAVDPPPATKGRWVGFNLKKELDGKDGEEPEPFMIPALD